MGHPLVMDTNGAATQDLLEDERYRLSNNQRGEKNRLRTFFTPGNVPQTTYAMLQAGLLFNRLGAPERYSPAADKLPPYDPP
jgi:hypothetical protein